jgi:hypothetical protein
MFIFEEPKHPIALPRYFFDYDCIYYRAFFYSGNGSFRETSEWDFTPKNVRTLTDPWLKWARVKAFGCNWSPVLFFPEGWPPVTLEAFLKSDYDYLPLF